jgi:hypothetical protein
LTVKGNRVYELKATESATEVIHANKVAMFNAGGEVTLFNRLGFNAVLWPSNFRRQDAKPNVHDHFFKSGVEMNIGSFSTSAEWKELLAMENTKIIFPYRY